MLKLTRLELLLQTREIVHRAIDALGVFGIWTPQQRPALRGDARRVRWMTGIPQLPAGFRQHPSQRVHQRIVALTR